MRVLIALAALLLAGGAFAETKTITWQNATKNEDGSDIPATGAGALVRTVVEYGTRNAQGGFGTKQGEVFVAAPANTLDLNLVVIQQYALRAFHCNTFATTFARNATGCSDFSNVALTEVLPPSPAPPASLTVQADTTAFVIVKSRDRVAMVPVGNVAPGTQCDTTQQVLGRYVVPRAAVTFVASVSDEVVFASCS